jgi:hypothetical protein
LAWHCARLLKGTSVGIAEIEQPGVELLICTSQTHVYLQHRHNAHQKSKTTLNSISSPDQSRFPAYPATPLSPSLPQKKNLHLNGTSASPRTCIQIKSPSAPTDPSRTSLPAEMPLPPLILIYSQTPISNLTVQIWVGGLGKDPTCIHLISFFFFFDRIFFFSI